MNVYRPKVFSAVCILSTSVLIGCTTAPKTASTDFNLPEYTQGFSLPVVIPADRESKLYQLMNSSGLDSFIQKRPTAKPTKGVMAHLKTLDKSKRIPYTSCASRASQSGPAYYSLIAELNENLSNDEIETLLKFYQSSAGRKVAEANRKTEAPVLSPEENALASSIQSTIDKKLQSLYTYDRWLINYDQQIIDACTNA